MRGRCDVERRIVSAAALGRGLPTEGVGDLRRCSFFDGDFFPALDRQIESTRRCGDVERNSVGFSEDRQRIRSDLIGLVSVGGDSIGSDNHGLDAAFVHHPAGHRIADQRDGDAALHQFPRRESGSL